MATKTQVLTANVVVDVSAGLTLVDDTTYSVQNTGSYPLIFGRFVAAPTNANEEGHVLQPGEYHHFFKPKVADEVYAWSRHDGAITFTDR